MSWSIAPALRDGWGGVGLVPRAALRSGLGYFRSLPPGGRRSGVQNGAPEDFHKNKIHINHKVVYSVINGWPLGKLSRSEVVTNLSGLGLNSLAVDQRFHCILKRRRRRSFDCVGRKKRGQ